MQPYRRVLWVFRQAHLCFESTFWYSIGITVHSFFEPSDELKLNNCCYTPVGSTIRTSVFAMCFWGWSAIARRSGDE